MITKRTILFMVVTLTLGFWPAGVIGAEKNTIQSLDQAGLKNLMTDETTPHLIVAMAAWCGPCRKELPALSRLFTKYQPEGLNIAGISVDLEGPKAMQPIVDKLQVKFPVYWVGEKAVKDYAIYGIPMLFLIKDGKVIEKIPGKRSEKFIEQKIELLLQK